MSRSEKEKVNDIMASRKHPRDFVFIDAFWEADDSWEEYYLKQSVWVYMDEYHAELNGDEDYCRIIIHSSNERGWKYSRRMQESSLVHAIADSIKKPVNEANLIELGFERWLDSYI